MHPKQRLVVVGSGMAGSKVLEEILARDPGRYALSVVGEEAAGNYNRIKLVVRLKEPNLPDFFLNTPEWYAQNGVQAWLGQPVAAIDRAARKVVLANGRRVDYDLLVLATGARPFIPPIQGLDLPGVFALRRLEDIERVQRFLEDRSRVMVVGGGLLGIELALMLRLLGKQVTVSHLMPTLMEMQLPEEAGRYLQRHLEALGIRFVLGTHITELLGSTGGVEKAVFKNGAKIETEAVFFSCGIRPNTDLAKACGLLHNRGIVVDGQLRTSDPAVYACGECVEFNGETWGLVAPVYEQARTLAGVLTGENVTYTPSAPTPTRLKSDIPVLSMGRFKPQPGDEVTSYADPTGGVFKQLIIRDSVLAGAVLVGEDLNADTVSLHYTARIPVPPRRADLLFPGARAGEAILDGKQIPDDAQVCDCNGVSAGKIRKAIHGGCDTLQKVMANTKAGTGCGNCKNKIKALLISEVGELREDPAEKYYVAGIPLDREALTALIRERELKSVSQVLAAVPGSVDDSKTRMGLDYLLGYLWKSEFVVEEDSRCANDRYFGNIQKTGLFSVIPDMPGGVATSRQLRALADAADKYGALIKVTGADRIGLYSVHKRDLRRVWDDLQMNSGHAFTKCFRACKSCVGSAHCRFGLMDSLGLAQRMGTRYRGTMGPAKFKMGVSGCPRNCAEATIKDFGVVAVENGWDVFIGGNGGAHVYAAKKIVRYATDDEVIRCCDRFYEYFRRHAKYGERAAYLVERVGLATVVDAVVNATPEALRELETSFQAALDAYRDPWKTATGAMDNEAPDEADEPGDGAVQVALEEDIRPGAARLVHVRGKPVAVFHGRDGRWVAANGVCPHEGGPVVDSLYGNGRLTCPLHSYSFDVITGRCDNAEFPPLGIYPVEVREGRVLVRA